MGKTLTDLIMEDESTSMVTREDWSNLGKGLIVSEAEIQDILAGGYDSISE